ncbi:hypothetical protein WMY93_025759 [Mugilogobius chulae]|uniref:Uncharacterized protein n=1 Tax=Mugilogobius chulae TaxID=88201 RepID=A0AAW0N5E5_9GOBI
MGANLIITNKLHQSQITLQLQTEFKEMSKKKTKKNHLQPPRDRDVSEPAPSWKDQEENVQLETRAAFGTMVAAVLKLYFIGTALTVLAVLYGIVDSIGGLMYAQDQRYFLELHGEKQRDSECKTLRCKHRTVLCVTQTCCDKA